MFQFWSRKRSSEGSNWWNTACNSKLASYVIHVYPAFCRVLYIAGVAGISSMNSTSFLNLLGIQWGTQTRLVDFMWLMCNFPSLTPRLPNNCFTMFGVGVHLCTSKPKVLEIEHVRSMVDLDSESEIHSDLLLTAQAVAVAGRGVRVAQSSQSQKGEELTNTQWRFTG